MLIVFLPARFIQLRGHVRYTGTLLRKNIHTRVDDPEEAEKCFAFLCMVERHKVPTGKKNYVCGNPQKDADIAMKIYKAFFGDSVEWPSDEDFQLLKKPIDALLSKSAKAKPEAEEDGKGEEALVPLGGSSSGNKRKRETTDADGDDSELAAAMQAAADAVPFPAKGKEDKKATESKASGHAENAEATPSGSSSSNQSKWHEVSRGCEMLAAMCWARVFQT